MNDQELAQRFDAWTNALAGVNTSGDKSRGLTFRRNGRLAKETLEALYEEDAIAARVVDRLVDDAFREGWDFATFEGTDANGDPLNVEDVYERLERLGWEEPFAKTARWSRLYGGAVMVLPVADHRSPSEPLPDDGLASELLTPFAVNGWDAQPLYTDSGWGSSTYGQTLSYRIQGIEGSEDVDASRVVPFEPIPMPYDVTIRAESRWGPSVLDRMFDRLSRYGAAQSQALGVMWNASLLWIKMKNWRQLLQTKDGKTQARRYLEAMNEGLRANGLLGLDSEDEMGSIDRQLANLDQVILRFRDATAEGADMPREILFNESPAGLNAGELSGPQELWFAAVAAWQRKEATPRMRKVFDIAFRSWGWSVSKFEIRWLPLWTKSEEATATTRKTVAEADALDIQSGIVDPEELRRRRYPDLVEDEPVIDLTAEGEAEALAQAGGGQPDKVQDEALNGAQITALSDLVARVVAGELPRDAAIAIIAAAFPAVAGKARELLGSAGMEVLDLRQSAAGAPEVETVEDAPDDVISPAEAGRILNVSPATIRKMAKNGAFRSWILNGRYRVSKSEILSSTKYEPPKQEDEQTPDAG